MGVTIAVIVMPGGFSARRKVGTIGAFILLANTPDLPFPGWGHDRYDISHSLFTTGVLSGLLAAAFLLVGRLKEWAGGVRIVWGGVAAWVSHLLLDTTYNHGHGLKVFWPFSDASVALTLPWFETLKVSLPTITAHSLRVMGIELLFYGSVLLVVLLIRWISKGAHECRGS